MLPVSGAEQLVASAARGLSLSENARLFALLTVASADSQIVAFDEKYNRPHWRPITAIRAATDLNITALQGDIGWEPLLVTPPHPEYPSAHAIFSGAAEAVLRGYFGSDDVNVSVTAPGPFGVTRTYRKFSELTEEVDFLEAAYKDATELRVETSDEEAE
jgi:hypothetical protein